MRIIISPAKQMKEELDMLEPNGIPVFLSETEKILAWMKKQKHSDLQKIWKCSSKIAEQNFERLEHINLHSRLTPAILAYDGIAYKYMAPSVFEDGQIDYVQEHLRIISGFYGVVKPLDGVTPYRLEMGAKAKINGNKDLYELWRNKLYNEIRDESGIIVNLASKEYSKSVEKYIGKNDRFITICFCENYGGKLVTKGIYAKMARGEMVRYMAENKIENPEDMKGFDRLKYVFRADSSSESEFVFERKN